MGRFQWHPAEGRQERQGRGERELLEAESQALVRAETAHRRKVANGATLARLALTAKMHVRGALRGYVR